MGAWLCLWKVESEEELQERKEKNALEEMRQRQSDDLLDTSNKQWTLPRQSSR